MSKETINESGAETPAEFPKHSAENLPAPDSLSVIQAAAGSYERVSTEADALEHSINGSLQTGEDASKNELLLGLQSIRESARDRLRLVTFAGALLASTPAFATETPTIDIPTGDPEIGTLSSPPPTDTLGGAMYEKGKTAFNAVVIEQLNSVKRDAQTMVSGKDSFGEDVDRIDPALRLIQAVPFVDPRISGVASIVEEVKGGIGNQGQPLSIPAIHIAGILACAQVGYAPCLVIGFLSDSWAEKIDRNLDEATDKNMASIIDGLYPLHFETSSADTMYYSPTSPEWTSIREIPVETFLDSESSTKPHSTADTKLKTYLELMGDAVDAEPKKDETVAAYTYRVTRIATKDIGDFKPIALEQYAAEQNTVAETTPQ